MINNSYNSVNIPDEEFAHLIKCGRADEIQAAFKEQLKPDYSLTFPGFMTQMLEKYEVNRKQIADRSGLSYDYVGKLIRGVKNVGERDYVIAMCIAVGMGITETQHALNLSGFRPMADIDNRDKIIMVGISEKRSVYDIDELLENVGMLAIKVSPDMPSYKPVLAAAYNAETSVTMNALEAKAAEKAKIVRLEDYKEMSRDIEAEYTGPAPFDYRYWGIIGIETDDGDKYYAEASYSCDYTNYIVLDEENYLLSQTWMKDNEEKQRAFFESHPELNGEVNFVEDEELYNQFIRIVEEDSGVEVLEQYESLGDAASSPFFDLFYQLDKATDKKVLEVMAEVDDTRNQLNGIRIGSTCDETYAEMFNKYHPERNEYLQIARKKDGSMHFTATNRSCFMRKLLGLFYEPYFGNSKEPEQFISVENLSDLDPSQHEYNAFFRNLLLVLLRDKTLEKEQLEEQLKEEYGDKTDSILTSDEEVYYSKIKAEQLDLEIRTFYDNGMFYLGQNEFVKAKDQFEKILSNIELLKQMGIETDYTVIKAVNYHNLRCAYYGIGMEEEADALCWKLYDMKDQVVNLAKNGVEIEEALGAVSEATLFIAQTYQKTDLEKTKKYTLDTIDILEGNCTCEMAWVNLFKAYLKYASAIDTTQPEEAASMYKKAVTVVRRQKLDQKSDLLEAIFVLYNNYAWTLWNMLGRDEAVIYYGQAIDLMAANLENPDYPEESCISNIEHAGDALYELYSNSDRPDEAERLKCDLAEYGISLD